MVAADVCSTQSLASHPTGMWVLAMTETWERFSYYGVRALLVLYLTSGGALAPKRFEPVYGSTLTYSLFGRPHGAVQVQALSSQINQWYSGLAFITPLLGGLVADRLLGIRNTCVLGALLMAAAHACMAFSHLFLVGLALLVLGNGAFKPTVSAQVSMLYSSPEHVGLRDAGFALFYMSINLGALLSPLVCGFLQQRVGFHWGFGAAGIGMCIAIVIYLCGSAHLPSEKIRKVHMHMPHVRIHMHMQHVSICRARRCETYTCRCVCSMFTIRKVHGSDADPSSMYTCMCRMCTCIPMRKVHGSDADLSSIDETRQLQGTELTALSSLGHADGRSEETTRLSPRGKSGETLAMHWQGEGPSANRQALALAAICILLLPYWACWEQMANTVPLFYDERVERTLFSWSTTPVPAAALQALSPIFTIALLPAFSNRWAHEARAGAEQSAARKLAIGVAFSAVGWLLMAASAVDSTPTSKSSLLGPLAANLFYTLGHIHVGPVGLALVTRCAPHGAESSAVGLWLLSSGVGGVLAGSLGTYYSLWSPARFFANLAGIAAACTLVIILLVPRLERIARGIEVS